MTTSTYPGVLVGLPIADRRVSCRFYTEVLGIEPFGAPADDGVPEPLQFALNDGMRIMLIPTGGFDWVIGEHRVAPAGHSECILGITAATRPEVGAIVARARAAGGTVVTEPGEQGWGYAAAFADPDGHIWTVTPAG